MQPALGAHGWVSVCALREPGSVLSICSTHILLRGFPEGSAGKESSYNAGDMDRSLIREDPLEEEMATQSSILAWEILWTEEPGGLQPMGRQRVGYNLATEQAHKQIFTLPPTVLIIC